MATKINVGGGSLSLMTLADLIRSSAMIHSKTNKYGYSMAQALQKEFGTVYYNNKVVVYNPDTHILEIRMGIGTKTEKAYRGMHSVRMAIYGVAGTIYDSIEDLYIDKTGMTPETDDMNDMKKSIRGETSTAMYKRLNDIERGRTNQAGKEVNKFSVTYQFDPHAQLEGYIIPVASVDPDSGAYTYEDSGKIFYMERPIDINSYVRVSCSCSNYYFVHGWYNYNAGAHLGQKPAPYPGKSSSSETVMNMTKSPGMCKHLMMFTMLLLNGGILSKMGTKGFNFNFQDIRNRTEKLQIPRKLADSGDWGNHLRQLQRTLRNADRRHVAQYGNDSLTDKFKKWERSNMEKNSINFDNFMSSQRKNARDKYYSNAPIQDFSGDINKIRDQYGAYTDDILTDRVGKVLDLFRHQK